MSTYFSATVLVVGRHQHVLALNQYILRAEMWRPAEAFSYKTYYLNERLAAVLYRSGKSRYEPQLTVAVDVLGDINAAIARLDYCVYLYQDAESALSPQERVYRRGKTLRNQQLWEDEPTIDALGVFKHCCRSEMSLSEVDLGRLSLWMRTPDSFTPPTYLSRVFQSIRRQAGFLPRRLQNFWKRIGRRGNDNICDEMESDETDPF
jgi:DNA-directed RNA polymerase subunit N (RpoN/RPB10)